MKGGYNTVEIQLRTLGMEFWASMEYRYCYKNENSDNGKELFDLYRKYSDEIQR